MEDNITGVIDTIDCANQHNLRLAGLLSSIKEAKSQVQSSSATSSQQLREHFEELKLQLVTTLNDRFTALQSQISEIEKAALTPLAQCEAVIEKDITVTSQILNQGKTLLGGNHDSNQAAMVEYKSRANEMGFASLPEVPHLSDVACIYLETPDVLRRQLLTVVSNYGRVISRAPVQISSVSERPGSLLIKWAEVEDEDSQDLSEFCLQYFTSPSNNNAQVKSVSSAPTEVNVGSATSYTLRHIRPMKSYTFLVRGRAEGTDIWSPWSIPYTGLTTIPHYKWRTDSEGYTTSHENKIGERLPTPSDDLLFSQDSSYTCGHSIILRVIESGDTIQSSSTEADRQEIEEGLALTVSDEQGSLLRSGVIFVSANGGIFLDGQEKLTKLPALKRGSVVTFDTEILSSGKVRLTVEVDEKIVTFDWAVKKPKTSPHDLISAISMSQGVENELSLYFAMKFSNAGWRIGVE